MKIIKAFLIGLLIMVICYSCNNSYVEYYDSGQVKQKIEYHEQSNYSITEYYENGNVKTTGRVQDSSKVGVWKEYFSNGDLRWEGDYLNNILDELSESDEEIITLYKNPKLLIQSNGYKIRIKIPKEYLEIISVSVDNGNKVLPSIKQDEYDFLLEALNKGNLTINLYLKFDGEVHKVRTKLYQVSDSSSL